MDEKEQPVPPQRNPRPRGPVPAPAGEFERLLAESGGDTFRPIAAGDKVEGRIVALGTNSFLVDIGQRSEGVVPREAFTPEELSRVNVGDRAEFYVTRISSSGIELSRAYGTRSLDLDQLVEAQKTGVPVEGKVSGENKGGFTVDLPGGRGFVPYSQMELGAAHPYAEYAGRTLRFRVTQVRGRDIVLSRAAILREETERERRELLARLEEGQVVDAVVARHERFGVFVDLGSGLDALVPASELSWSRSSDVRSALPPGTPVSVKILKVDTSDRRRPKISASLKQLGEDPWTAVAEQFREGSVVRGRVTRLTAFGAFVELVPGVEGLVHVSEMARGRHVQHPGEIVRPGQEVEAAVLSVDAAARRIGLSLDTGDQHALDEETRARYLGERAAPGQEKPAPGFGSSMADALRRALEKKPPR